MNFPLFTPFTNEWIFFFIFLILITSIVLVSNLAFVYNFASSETIRKYVHIFIGFLTSLSPIFFSENKIPIILASIFIVLNIIALKYDLFKGIHSTNRVTYGTIYFPIAYLILCSIFWNYSEFIILSLAILTFSDPLASSIGSNIKSPYIFIVWKDSKTFQGAIAFFLCSFSIISFGSYLMFDFTLIEIFFFSLFTSLFSTIGEITSYRGSDNLTIPIISILFMIIYFEQFVPIEGTKLIVIFLLIAIILILYGFYEYRFLSLDGLIGASIMSVIITIMGSITHLLSIASFFILSSLIEKLLKKKSYQRIKKSNRNIIQVYANGGIALALCIYEYLNPHLNIFPLFLASISAAMSDTWGTEFGKLSKHKPISIITFKKVNHGASGGITFIGTLGSLFGACLFGVSIFIIIDIKTYMIIAIIFCGFFSSLFDSILGATIQAKYETNSGEIIEFEQKNTKLYSGTQYVNNNMVNFLSTIFASIIMYGFLWVK